MREFLVEDATFVTMAADAGPAGAEKPGAMLVRDGRIAAIGPAAQVRAAAGGVPVVRLDGATDWHMLWHLAFQLWRSPDMFESNWAATQTVDQRNLKFSVRTLTVAKGDSVEVTVTADSVLVTDGP